MFRIAGVTILKNGKISSSLIYRFVSSYNSLRQALILGFLDNKSDCSTVPPGKA